MSEATLSAKQTKLCCEEPDGAPVLYLPQEGKWREAMVARPLLKARFGEEYASLKLTDCWRDGDLLALRGTIAAPGGDWYVDGVVRARPEFVDSWEFRLSVTNRTGQASDCSIQAEFEVVDQGVPRWMVPAMFYKHNRPESCVRQYPRFDPKGGDSRQFVSNEWHFASDRAALPAAFCWTDHLLTAMVVPPTFRHGMTGIGFAGDGKRTRLMANFPEREEPVRYASFAPSGSQPHVGTVTLDPGEETELRFWIYAAPPDLHGYDPVVRAFYNSWRKQYSDNPWVTAPEANELAAYGLLQWHYEAEQSVLYETCAFDSYYGKGPKQVGRPHMHVSWVSGIPYAFALLWYGCETNSNEHRTAGQAVIDKVCREGLAPCGGFWSQWTAESGWGTGWNPNPDWLQSRTMAEATLFLIRAIAFERAQGREHPEWLAAAESNLQFALRVQREDGNFGSYYHKDSGQVEEWDGAGGLLWIAALLEGQAIAPSFPLREAAVRAGEYYARFVEDEYIYGAPEDVHLTPTSEDGYNAIIAYVALYEALSEQRWLDLARRAADWTMTFRYAYNVAFPEHTMLRQYDFRTLGADMASVANNHLHNYGLVCHPELLKLWHWTQDGYYLDRALDHLLCFHQFIARRDGDFGARKGMVPEQWYQTDWTHPKGSVLPLAHAWCAGLILYANLATEQHSERVLAQSK